MWIWGLHCTQFSEYGTNMGQYKKQLSYATLVYLYCFWSSLMFTVSVKEDTEI